MAQKKRGVNPIRITLTEDQISDIIQSAAKTRRGLKVESLEDRIAPSIIGGPMLGDVVDPGLPVDEPVEVVDPNAPVEVVDPNAPVEVVDPNAPVEVTPPGEPVPVEPVEGSLPTDPNLPPLDPTDPGLNPEEPIDPFAFDPLNPPTGPSPDSGPDQAPALDVPNPDAGGVTGSDPVEPQPNHDPVPDPVQPASPGNALPSSEEIEEHRRNILRQLRGN